VRVSLLGEIEELILLFSLPHFQLTHRRKHRGLPELLWLGQIPDRVNFSPYAFIC
jgi:hypothetical protein